MTDFLKTLAILTALLLLQSCATPYQTLTSDGGYSETQLNKTMFRVFFNGNSSTSREQVEDFTLLRSAELSLENGFPYFVIIDASTYIDSNLYSTPLTYKTTGTAYRNGNHIYSNAITTTTGGQSYTISQPSRSNTILCFTEKPSTGIFYDAKILYHSIRKKYALKSQLNLG